MRPALVAFASALVVVLGTLRAQATPSARLVYGRGLDAMECPDERALRHAVSARVGYDPFFPWAQQTVVVELSRDAEGYLARVQIVDDANVAHGSRQLRGGGEGCDALIDAAALAISIALDAAEAHPSPPPTEAPEPPAPRTPSVAPTPPAKLAPTAPISADEDVPPAVAPRRALAVAGFVGLQAVGSVGSAPEVSAGGELLAGVRTTRALLVLGLRLDAPASAPGDGGRVGATLVTASASPCFRLGPTYGCVTARVGQLRASAEDVNGGREASTLFAAVGPSAGLELPIGSAFSWRLQAEVLGNLQRASIDLNGQQAWHASPVLGSLATGLVRNFP